MHWGLDDRDPALLSGSGCLANPELEGRDRPGVVLQDVTHLWQDCCHLPTSEPAAGWL